MLLALLQAIQLLSADSLEGSPENANITREQAISQIVLNQNCTFRHATSPAQTQGGCSNDAAQEHAWRTWAGNSTTPVVRRVHTRVIEARFVTGCSLGTIVYIPRINSIKTNSQLPFKFRRRQFPVRLVFAMKINKSLGQTTAKAGLYLPTHCFSHSLLYVAKSGVKSRKALHVVVSCGQVEGRAGVYTKNIVQQELLMR